MNKQLADDLQKKLGISQEQIVREEYEMIILKQVIENQYKALRLVETIQEKSNFFGLFCVREDFMNQAFSIKFEASIRPVDLKKDMDYKLIALTSKITNLTVLAQVASLERIEKEKLTIQPPRTRDIFDLWFIAQKLVKPVSMDFGNMDKKAIRHDLFKFLPEKNKGLIEQWLKEK